MKAVSQNFKYNIKQFGREIDSYIMYNGEKIDGTYLFSIETKNYTDLLKSIMKGLNFECSMEIPVKGEIEAFFGVLVGEEYEYINLGKYIVKEAECKEDTKTWFYTCCDKMLLSMIDYEDLGVTYPITIRDYIKAIASHLELGFKNENETFPNYDKEIQGELYLTSEKESLNFTFRDILDDLSAVVAGNIIVNENDELEIKYINYQGTKTEIENTTLEFNTPVIENLDLTIQGNSIQEGTPTPDTPKEIETLKSWNLFTGFRQLGTNSSYENGKLIVKDLYGNISNYIKVGKNRTIRFSFKSTYNGFRYYITQYNSDKVEIKSTAFTSQTSITLENATIYYSIIFSMASGTPIPFEISELQIKEGPGPKPYLPKDSIGIKRIGKNLFDKNNVRVGYRFGSTGDYYRENGYNATEFIKVKSNTTYSTSWSIQQVECVCTYDKNYQFIRRIQSGRNFTTSDVEIYIRADVRDSYLDTAYIIEGTTGEYEPYQERIDYIDLKGNELLSTDKLLIKGGRATLIKNYKKRVFDGTEPDWKQSGVRASVHNILIDDIKPTSNNGEKYYNGISNYFENGYSYGDLTNTDTYSNGMSATADKYLSFKNSQTTSIASWKEWLTTHNLVAYYRLAEPQIIDLGEVQTISTLKGENHIELLSNLTTTLKTEYYSEVETLNEETFKDINVNFGGEFGPVNSIVFKRSAESDGIYMRDETATEWNEIVIKDNQILNGNNRDEYLEDIYKQLYGLKYCYFETDTIGVMYLDLLDRVKANIEGSEYDVLILNDEATITTGLKEKFYVNEMQKTESDYNVMTKTDKLVNNATLIVDKVGNEIIGRVEDLENGQFQVVDKSTGQYITITNITGDITDIKNTINGLEIDFTKNGTNLVRNTALWNFDGWLKNGYEPVYEGENPPTDVQNYRYWYCTKTNGNYENGIIYEHFGTWEKTDLLKKDIQGDAGTQTGLSIVEDKDYYLSTKKFLFQFSYGNPHLGLFSDTFEISPTQDMISVQFKAKSSITEGIAHIQFRFYDDTYEFVRGRDAIQAYDFSTEFINNEVKTYTLQIPIQKDTITAYCGTSEPTDTNMYWLKLDGEFYYLHQYIDSEWKEISITKFVKDYDGNLYSSIYSNGRTFYERTTLNQRIRMGEIAVLQEYNNEPVGNLELGDIKVEYGKPTNWSIKDGESFGVNHKLDELGYTISKGDNKLFLDEDELTGYYLNNKMFYINKKEVYSNTAKCVINNIDGLITKKIRLNGRTAYIRYYEE